MTETAHLYPEHIAAFHRACQLHNVAILVRQTNEASLRWFGDARATPKMIDCKAKTADEGFVAGGRRYDVAGLVVSPDIAGPAAFRPDKLQAARDEWGHFSRTMLPPKEASRDHVMVWHDGHFFKYYVNEDRDSPFYGCVMHSPTTLRAAAKVVHGDFDLYAIIDLDNPSDNIRVPEKLAGQPHTRSPKFRDVQAAINGPMGLRMPVVRHGSQETFKSHHTDEPVDVFFPDGTMRTLNGAAQIEAFYRDELGGRALFGKDDAGVQHHGLYRRAVGQHGRQRNPVSGNRTR
ncbi:MAG: hypothetical protein AAGJ94_10510 [Pseudomonadota bacterium]